MTAKLANRDNDKFAKVSGVVSENITLKFGDDGSAEYGKLLEVGVFDKFSREKIFENKNTCRMLA